MSLFEQWTADDSTKVSVHSFFGWLHIWLTDAEGFGAAAGTRAVEHLGLDAQSTADAVAIKAKFDALGSGLAKAEFVARIHAVAMLAEADAITKPEAKALLGF